MTTTKRSDEPERVIVPITMDIAWRYAASEAMLRLSSSLKERRIEAVRCDGCGRRYLPPRPFCGNCRLRMNTWVDVTDEGVVVAATVVNQPIMDGRTGKMRPSPYGMALIRLDGADTTLNHYVIDNDLSRLVVGARVRAVWRDTLAGAFDDIMHFEVVS